ncbi:MAG: hypothetical protein K8R69_04910, partial [Deltaproteobacteria bacterium]|nr:hypothetical protein [Deltaproteobacteria bacterium]
MSYPKVSLLPKVGSLPEIFPVHSAPQLPKFPGEASKGFSQISQWMKEGPGIYQGAVSPYIPLGIGFGVSLAAHAYLLYRAGQTLEVKVDKYRRKLEAHLIESAEWRLRNLPAQAKPDSTMGNFIYLAEGMKDGTAAPELEMEFKRQWTKETLKIQARIAPLEDSELKRQHLIFELFDQYFYHYRGGQSQFTPLFQQKGGNCQAQTKLILSMLGAVDIPLKEGEGIGIQLYKDHVEPVFFRRDGKGNIIEVEGLVTGKRSSEIVAPIYHPYLVYAAFLKKSGKSLPVEMESLKLADPNVNRSAEKVAFDMAASSQTDAFEFPPSEVISGLPAPEDSVLSRPSFSPSTVSNEGANSEKPVHIQWITSNIQGEVIVDLNSDFYIRRKDVVVFRHQDQADTYRSIEDEAERKEYLKSLLKIEAKKHGEWAPFK